MARATANPFRQPAGCLGALTAPSNPEIVSSHLLFELFDLFDFVDAQIVSACPRVENSIDLSLKATVHCAADQDLDPRLCKKQPDNDKGGEKYVRLHEKPFSWDAGVLFLL
jgi:hypothetical protein